MYADVGHRESLRPGSTMPDNAPINYGGVDLLIVDTKTNKAVKCCSAFEALNMLYQIGAKVCFQAAPDLTPLPSTCQLKQGSTWVGKI